MTDAPPALTSSECAHSVPLPAPSGLQLGARNAVLKEDSFWAMLTLIRDAPDEQKRRWAQAEYAACTRSAPFVWRTTANMNDAHRMRQYKTVVATLNQDCVVLSHFLARHVTEGPPAMMNMANDRFCGGYFSSMKGKTQEEYLFRCTTLVASLWPHRKHDDPRFPEGTWLGQGAPYYPFTECGGVLSPEVYCAKPGFEHRCSIVSIAAQDLAGAKTRSEGFDVELTRQKFRTCLGLPAQNGNPTLVLGAIGCGAFHNDPRRVASVFRELLDQEFQGVFVAVLFAVIHSATNLKAFREHFPLRTLDEIRSQLAEQWKEQ